MSGEEVAADVAVILVRSPIRPALLDTVTRRNQAAAIKQASHTHTGINESKIKDQTVSNSRAGDRVEESIEGEALDEEIPWDV